MRRPGNRGHSQRRPEHRAHRCARQQKLHGEELLPVAFLEAVRGDLGASQRDLKQFAAARPWISPHYVELWGKGNQAVAALAHADGRGALDAFASVPDFQDVSILYSRARAHQLVNDYVTAEAGYRTALKQTHNFSNFGNMRGQVPLFALLSHFYLGQLYEATGKSQQAIDEYQSFLSHFEGSRTRMPQVGEARAALKRMMH